MKSYCSCGWEGEAERLKDRRCRKVGSPSSASSGFNMKTQMGGDCPGCEKFLPDRKPLPRPLTEDSIRDWLNEPMPTIVIPVADFGDGLTLDHIVLMFNEFIDQGLSAKWEMTPAQFKTFAAKVNNVPCDEYPENASVYGVDVIFTEDGLLSVEECLRILEGKA